MITITCDRCKENVTPHRCCKLDIPIHIIDPGYEDVDGEPLSCKKETCELCQKCYNKAMTAAYTEINQPE